MSGLSFVHGLKQLSGYAAPWIRRLCSVGDRCSVRIAPEIDIASAINKPGATTRRCHPAMPATTRRLTRVRHIGDLGAKVHAPDMFDDKWSFCHPLLFLTVLPLASLFNLPISTNAPLIMVDGTYRTVITLHSQDSSCSMLTRSSAMCVYFIWQNPFRLQIVVKSIKKKTRVSGLYRG